MTSDATRLLEQADRILSGAVALPRGRGARIAAVLARSAVEDIVANLCTSHGVDASASSMRVKLATLVAVDEPQAGELSMAWWALSRACHQHAYEIAPSHSEVAVLVANIRVQTVKEN
jgi:hypothetical protein